MRIKMLTGLVACLVSWGTGGLCATNESVTLQFTTAPTTGKFSPRHVLAVWVADAKGQHVKTLESYGKRYRKHLAEWNKAIGGRSAKSSVDALTGATLTAHKQHTVTWDCRDERGNPVPDGAYEMFVEFTEQNGKGPIFRLPFNKGPGAAPLEPKPEPYFKDIKLTCVPPA